MSNLKIDDEDDQPFNFDQLQKEHSMANANTLWRKDTLVEA